MENPPQEIVDGGNACSVHAHMCHYAKCSLSTDNCLLWSYCRKEVYTEEKAKVVGASWETKLYLIHCRGSYFAPGLFLRILIGCFAPGRVEE